MDARHALEDLAGRMPSEIERHIYEISPVVGRAHYDRIAPIYDVVLATNVYNRAMWKTTPAAYRAFATRVFESRTSGTHVEIGCGSLLFTSHIYERDCGRPAILIDPSIEMLRSARARLEKASGAFPRHVVLARGDARTLEFPRATATTALSAFVMHVLDDPAPLLGSLSRVAQPKESTIAVSSIFKSGGRSNVALRLLHAAGELGPPRTLATIEQMMRAEIPGDLEVEISGSVALMTVNTSSSRVSAEHPGI
jgi:ubiquinone/menaquinone biosynthesis C-methylase UbiE